MELEGDAATGRQVLHIALEVPLGPFVLAGLGQGHHLALARVEHLADRTDHAALAGRVAPFDQYHQAFAVVLHPAGHAVELQVQLCQLLLVFFSAQVAVRLVTLLVALFPTAVV